MVEGDRRRSTPLDARWSGHLEGTGLPFPSASAAPAHPEEIDMWQKVWAVVAFVTAAAGGWTWSATDDWRYAVAGLGSCVVALSVAKQGEREL